MTERNVNYVRSRKEIVDKIEEIYKLGREKSNKVNLAKVMLATDVLDWVLGDSDYLNTNENGEIEWLI